MHKVFIHDILTENLGLISVGVVALLMQLLIASYNCT